MSFPQLEALLICDASPLILLAKIDCLETLSVLAREIWIPEAVWKEAVEDVDLACHPEAQRINTQFADCVRAANPVTQQKFETEVDPGEAAALAIASENPGACLLIDDRKGRQIAETNGWKVTGTLGWLIRAKEVGCIPLLRPLFLQLMEDGWYIETTLVNQILHSQGEQPICSPFANR